MPKPLRPNNLGQKLALAARKERRGHFPVGHSRKYDRSNEWRGTHNALYDQMQSPARGRWPQRCSTLPAPGEASRLAEYCCLREAFPSLQYTERVDSPL